MCLRTLTGVVVAGLLLGCGANGHPNASSAVSDSSHSERRKTFHALSTVSHPPGKLPQQDVHRSGIMPRFREIAESAGIRFTFFNDEVPGRFFLPEVMGGGIGWIDFDQDDLIDLYLVNGSRLSHGQSSEKEPINRLFHNSGRGSFDEVTSFSRAGQNGFGQGCAVGDFDADGFSDLYITNYGANTLLHNNGDGTFSDVTTQAGVSGLFADSSTASWSTSTLWFDAEGDGDLDLYVANYLDVRLANNKTCTYHGKPGYCGPGKYHALADYVYLNRGDGSFVESAADLGFFTPEGKGLAVVACDFDNDLRPEVYVANDMTANFLFTQTVAATGPVSKSHLYHNVANSAGCAVSRSGMNEASMGIACADFDGDGRPDVYLTHYYQMKNTLYHNLGHLLFDDDSLRAGAAATSYESLGFGTSALDYDRDGVVDLFIANGHVLGPHQQPNRMLPQLLHNDGTGRFEDVSSRAGPYFQKRWIGRGVATADFDNDGDMDVAVSHLKRPFALLRNDTNTGRHFVGVLLKTPGRIPPVGGRVTVRSDKRRWTMPIIAGGSYLSSSDSRLVFGLPDASTSVSIEVLWPSGRIDRFEHLDVDGYWMILEGRQPQRAPGTS